MATAVGMGLWATLTLGAHKLAPIVAMAAESFEVSMGLDVLPGDPE